MITANVQKVSPKIRLRANKALSRNDYKEAEVLLKKIIQIDSKDFSSRSNLALIYFETGRFDDFHQIVAALYQDYPDNAAVLNKYALSLLRQNSPKEAYQVLKKALELGGKSFETYINLSSVAAEVGDTRGGLEYAFEAIAMDPKSPSAHNNMGSALLAAGMVKEAAYTFDTVLELDPNNYFARTNLAVLATRRGDHASAVVQYENCLQSGHSDPIEIKKVNFFLGLAYLSVGNLERGWTHYKEGFVPGATQARNPVRNFKKPQWDFDLTKKVRLLVWREQGLGDELLFSSALADLHEKSDLIDVIVESDHRLARILQRSFPKFTVRPQAYWDDYRLSAVFDDYDCQVPLGDLFGFFRGSQSSFTHSGPYLSPEESAISLFEKRLGPRHGGLRVGICWRSGALSATRNIGYTSIVDWLPILQVGGVQFINLQYGETSAELAKASTELGVHINHWPDLDLKDDIENTSALCRCLDLVISVGTASAQIACATGTPTLILSPGYGWPSFGTSGYPVYPNARILVPTVSQNSVAEILPYIAKALGNLTPGIENPVDILPRIFDYVTGNMTGS